MHADLYWADYIRDRTSWHDQRTACRGQGASEQAADDEDFEQREHNRDAAGDGLEQKARQQRLIMEKVRLLHSVRQTGSFLLRKGRSIPEPLTAGAE